MTLQKHA